MEAAQTSTALVAANQAMSAIALHAAAITVSANPEHRSVVKSVAKLSVAPVASDVGVPVARQEKAPDVATVAAKRSVTSAVPKRGVAAPPAAPARRARRPAGAGAATDACKISVLGFPPYTQAPDLVRAFNKIGKAEVEKLTPKFAYVSFATGAEAAAAVRASGALSVYGALLTVAAFDARRDVEAKIGPKQHKRLFPKTKQKSMIVEPACIDLTGSFHQQLDAVLAAVRLTQEEATAISSLYADVEQMLQQLWPGCVAMPFGSITTGQGIKTSDADCFVKIPPQFHHPNANFVNKAKRVLQSHPQTFSEILSIPRANTPIVKFFHIPTQVNCDLSFKTPLGAQNSKLIAFLLHADPRLLPVAVLIKYWAKVHGLSGTGKLTNYALTMLIIFYLQQSPLSILPAVEWLQRDRANDFLVDFWNTGFMENHTLLPPISDTSTISELLGGFFTYYSKFNFETTMVCPYLGKPIEKQAFKLVATLPPEFDLYKHNVLNGFVHSIRFTMPLCVQDPFEQCHNVASGISSNLASEIKEYFKFAAAAYEKEKPNDCKEFLKTILLQKPKFKRPKSNPEFRVPLFPKIIANIVEPDWKAVVREIMMTIFEEMLLIKLEKVEEKPNLDSKKQREKYKGIVTKRLWKRKQFSRVYSLMKLEFVEEQKKITQEVIAVDKHVINLEFHILATYASSPKSAVVTLRFLKGQSDQFKEFGVFFISIMQGWMTRLLSQCSKPAGDKPGAVKHVDSDGTDSDEEDAGVVVESVEFVNKTNNGQCNDNGNPKVLPASDEGIVKESL